MTIDEAAVGKGVAVLFGPSAKNVVVLLVGKLSQVTEKERGGRRGLEQTKRRAETSDDEEEERPETVKRDGRREDEKRGKGEREWHRRHLCFLSFHLTHSAILPARSLRLAMASSSLDHLKQSLRDQGLYSPPEGDSPASHDDATLLSVAFLVLFLC